MFILTYQFPTSYHNLLSPLIDSLDPIRPYLYSSQPTYPIHIVLLPVTNIHITLHGHFYSNLVDIYTLLLAQVHGRYRVLDAELGESVKGGKGSRGRRMCGTVSIMTGKGQTGAGTIERQGRTSRS